MSDGGSGADFGISGGDFGRDFTPSPDPTSPRYTPIVPPAPNPVTPPGGYPASAGAGGPGAASGGEPGERPLLIIGDIVVTQNTVRVPHGTYPLRGTTWVVQDATQVTEAIPTYAIVLAIVFALFCLLGLLFLLIKEKRYAGFVAVTVTGEGFVHSAYLAPGPVSAQWAHDQVNQARALAARAA